MSNQGSYLAVGQFLNTGDYLVSGSGVFFAIMQDDGNLCVYRGSGPSDERGESALWCWSNTSSPSGQYFTAMQDDGNLCVYPGSPNDSSGEGALWCWSNKSSPSGQYFAAMQDDGNLCVYKSNSGEGALWCTMAIDPIVDISTISSITYHIESAKIIKQGPAELYRKVVHNKTEVPQTSTISGSISTSMQSGWSDSLGVKVGAKTTFETGIPFVAKGEVEVSAEVSNTFTWNGSTTKTQTFSFSTPVSVPPQSSIIALVSSTVSTVSVPCTVICEAILKSGVKLPAKIQGLYVGTNSHDLEVTFVTQKDGSIEVTSAGLDAI